MRGDGYLRSRPFSDIFHHEKNEGRSTLTVAKLASTEQRGTCADVLEIVFDQRMVEVGVLGKDAVEGRFERRAVPLAVAGLVDKSAGRLFRSDFEKAIKSSAGSFDLQVRFKDDQGGAEASKDVIGVKLRAGNDDAWLRHGAQVMPRRADITGKEGF